MYGRSTPRRRTAWQTLFTLALAATLLLALTFVLVGCGSGGTGDNPSGDASEGSFPVTVTDDVGNAVTIEAQPMRIVSTAPANTQTLFALGVGDRVVGVTSLDEYPAAVADLPKVGDFQVNTEAVMALSPDLVVGYSGNEEGLAPVQEAGADILIFNPATVEGIYANIATIGAAVGASQQAADLVLSLKASVDQLAATAALSGEAPTVFYALGSELYTAGPGSFVDELLTLISATNVASLPEVVGEGASAWPQFTPEQLVAADPDLILLSGLAFTSAEEFTQDARFAGMTAVKEGGVLLVPAEADKLFTAPGPRFPEGLEAVMKLIHSEAQ